MLSLIHISEPTRRRGISYAVFCLKKKTGERRREPKKREEKRKAEGTREGVKRKRAGKARGGGGGGDDDHRRRDGKGERRDRRDDHRREEGRHTAQKWKKGVCQVISEREEREEVTKGRQEGRGGGECRGRTTAYMGHGDECFTT